MFFMKIFIEFLKIGSISFGGGLATLPNIYKMVERTNWCTVEDITNMLTISQMTPGPLACNVAAYIGCRTGGLIAAMIATIAFVIPAIIYMGIVCMFLDKFKKSTKLQQILKMLRACAVALITSSSIVMFKIAFLNNSENISVSNFIININYKAIILAVLLVILVKKYKITKTSVFVISAGVGLIFKF